MKVKRNLIEALELQWKKAFLLGSSEWEPVSLTQFLQAPVVVYKGED